MVSLSKRLSMNLSLLKPCEVLADIGCDHAYSSIYACANGIAKRAYACDLREGPLKKAKLNVSEAGLSDRISLILCDGLTGIKPGQADAILISGMGGILMSNILNESKETVLSATQLVLQPQSDIGLVRHFLIENGFTIDDENMVYEDGKYYQSFRAVKGQAKPYEDECLYEYGDKLVRSNNEVLKAYLMHRLERISLIENNMKELEEGSKAWAEKRRILAALKFFE